MQCAGVGTPVLLSEGMVLCGGGWAPVGDQPLQIDPEASKWWIASVQNPQWMDPEGRLTGWSTDLTVIRCT